MVRASYIFAYSEIIDRVVSLALSDEYLRSESDRSTMEDLCPTTSDKAKLIKMIKLSASDIASALFVLNRSYYGKRVFLDENTLCLYVKQEVAQVDQEHPDDLWGEIMEALVAGVMVLWWKEKHSEYSTVYQQDYAARLLVIDHLAHQYYNEFHRKIYF